MLYEAFFTVWVEFSISTCLVSSHYLNHGSRWIGCNKYHLAVNDSVCGASWWAGILFRLYSCYVPNVLVIGYRSTITLTKKQWYLLRSKKVIQQPHKDKHSRS